jgi:hypothetical protein
LEPLICTSNTNPNVEPFKSGVEKSLNVALVVSQTDITTPALMYPEPLVITYSKCALEPVNFEMDAIVTPVVLIDEPDCDSIN